MVQNFVQTTQNKNHLHKHKWIPHEQTTKTQTHMSRDYNRWPKEAQTNTPEYSVTESIFTSHTHANQILRIDGLFCRLCCLFIFHSFHCLVVNTLNSYSLHVCIVSFTLWSSLWFLLSACSMKKTNMHATMYSMLLLLLSIRCYFGHFWWMRRCFYYTIINANHDDEWEKNERTQIRTSYIRWNLSAPLLL